MDSNQVFEKIEQIKSELGVRLRWIGWGVVIFILAQMVWLNISEVPLDVVFTSFKAPGIVLFACVFLAGVLLGKISRAISTKIKELEARARERLQEMGDAQTPQPTTPA